MWPVPEDSWPVCRRVCPATGGWWTGPSTSTPRSSRRNPSWTWPESSCKIYNYERHLLTRILSRYYVSLSHILTQIYRSQVFVTHFDKRVYVTSFCHHTFCQNFMICSFCHIFLNCHFLPQIVEKSQLMNKTTVVSKI